MFQNAHDTYLESRVLSADPIELVRMLLLEAAKAVGNARRHLAAGDIAARARSISQARAVVIELATSLDHERGGKFSANLGQLYEYMLRRLTEANFQQSDRLLAEVLGLLGTLSEGWDGVKGQGAVAASARREDSLPQLAHPKPDAKSGGSWEQPSKSTPATYGTSWSQPGAHESPASYGNSWAQPVAPETGITYGGSRIESANGEPAAAMGNPWAQTAAPPTETSYENAPVQPASWERPAAQENVAAYGRSWVQPASQEHIGIYDNPWTTPEAQEPATGDGSPWAHLAPQDPLSSYSPHDWSL